MGKFLIAVVGSGITIGVARAVGMHYASKFLRRREEP